MKKRADGIHPGIAVRDHHALRTRGRAAGIIDCEQISLVNFRAGKFSRARVDHCFIVQPSRIRLRTPKVFASRQLDATSQGDEMFNRGKLFANIVDRAKIIAVCANHARTTVIDQINEVVSRQPIV